MSGLFLSTARRPRRRARRALVATGIVTVVALLLAAAYGAIALAERGSLPRGTTIGGVAVGGLSEDDARKAVERAAARRVDRPIRLLGPDGRTTTTGGELRAAPRIDEAIDTAGEGGTTRRVLARLGLQEGPHVELRYQLGPVAAAELCDRLDRRFGTPWRDADVVVDGDTVRVTEARAGNGVDRGAMRHALATLPASVTLKVVPVRPVVSTAEAEAAAARIAQLVDAPRRVRFQDAESTLTPRRLRALVGTERENGSLGISVEPRGLRASLRPRLGRFEVPARDATFWVGANRAHVVPSRPGRSFDLERISHSLVSNLDSTTHLARFERTPPAFTTEDAERLNIRDLVSEFTTYYSCCQPRVTNIQRAAELLDGTIIRPGESFSLNEKLGKRTEEKGFVSAPQIFNGRLEDAVGGGISQVATTLYNSAFFAGVKLVAHQAHQFYISRYPMGREATVSWGGPELVFRNDWPAAILMKVSASDTGITVRFYSRKLGRRVETTTGEPYAQVAPRTIAVPNATLPAGTTSTVQSAGESGFSVQYTRKVFKGDDLVKDERYTVRYAAQNAIVEVGTKKVKPKPKPKPQPAEPRDPPAGDAPAPAGDAPAPAEGDSGETER
jgi:vancomycin resistance protein YoaR